MSRVEWWWWYYYLHLLVHRFFVICMVLCRYGVDRFCGLHPDHKWYVSYLEQMGSVPVKIMQYIGKQDILHAESSLFRFCQHLTSDAPPHAYAFTTHRIQSSTTIRHRITDISEQTLGSGSVAQVHTCRVDGKEAVVKVLHPLAHMDMVLMYVVCACITPIMYRLTGTNMLMLANELCHQVDLTHEGHITGVFHDIAQCITASKIQVPRVLYHNHNVFVMSRQNGIHPTIDMVGPEKMYDILRRVGGYFMYTAICHGICHGDLHNGNYMYDPTSDTISVIDFGTYAHVSTLDKNPIVVSLDVLFSTNCSLEKRMHIFHTFFEGTYDDNVVSKFLNASKGNGNVPSIYALMTHIRLIGTETSAISFRGDTLYFLGQYNFLLSEIRRYVPGTPTMVPPIFIEEALSIARDSTCIHRETHVTFLKNLLNMMLRVIPQHMDIMCCVP